MTLVRLPNETDAQYIARLTAALAVTSDPSALRVKVSKSGAVSVYGLQRMPTTLFGEQWDRLAEFIPTVQQFIQKNRKYLAVKGQTFIVPARTAETEAVFAASAWGKDDDETPAKTPAPDPLPAQTQALIGQIVQ